VILKLQGWKEMPTVINKLPCKELKFFKSAETKDSFEYHLCCFNTTMLDKAWNGDLPQSFTGMQQCIYKIVPK
jgi:hypothetical protein